MNDTNESTKAGDLPEEFKEFAVELKRLNACVEELNKQAKAIKVELSAVQNETLKLRGEISESLPNLLERLIWGLGIMLLAFFIWQVGSMESIGSAQQANAVVWNNALRLFFAGVPLGAFAAVAVVLRRRD